jgi:DNA-binding NarL/FixJ family response regulator
MTCLRVLLVDDNLEYLDALRVFLGRFPQVERVASASTGEQALALARAFAPDLVFMDISMPGMGGVEATRRLKALRPQTVVVVLSLYGSDGQWRQAALGAGADHVIDKAEVTAALDRLIPTLAGGLSRGET